MHLNLFAKGNTRYKDMNVIYDIPTIFCVLTDNTMQQSIDRSGWGNTVIKVEAAIAAIKMVLILNRK